MSEEGGPRFSLPAGEGVGALLGLAAGDTAGGGFPGGYSASTQQATIVAYHLLRHGAIDRALLGAELAELDGDQRDPSAFRAPSADLRHWLDSRDGSGPDLVSVPSLDPAVRVAAVGVWFRQRPQDLLEAALETARVTHLDAPSAVLAAATSAAVAAACFAQNGRDMMMAVTDLAAHAARAVAGEDYRFSHVDAVFEVVERLRLAGGMLGSDEDRLLDEVGRDPVGLGVCGLTLAAPMTPEPHRPLQMAAAIGGSPLGAMVGAVVGARSGVRAWPWAFPNDTWFVAIGQRLVAGTRDLVDLPVPYAVEQRITHAPDLRQI